MCFHISQSSESILDLLISNFRGAIELELKKSTEDWMNGMEGGKKVAIDGI